MYIQIPVKTEVIAKNEAICTQGKFEDGKVVIEMDARRRDYKKLWNVPRGECIRWINERTFEVQELSSFAWPIVYRITTADGYYRNNGLLKHHSGTGLSQSELVNGGIISYCGLEVGAGTLGR